MRSRVEYRVPDASSNPYLSTLLVMGASYYTANILARIGGSPELPFAERVANGARMYHESYKEKHGITNIRNSKLTADERESIRQGLQGTVLSNAHRNSDYVRECYDGMLTSFQKHSLVLPTMREVGEPRDAAQFRGLVEKQAQKNFADPQNTAFGNKDKHYVPLR